MNLLIQQKKLIKYERYKAKVAKNSVKNDRFQTKINKLQVKNTKLQKKVNKLDNKITREKLLSNINSDLSKRKLKKNYNKTYKYQKKMVKRIGGNPNNFQVTSVDKYGRITGIKGRA